MWNRYYYEGCRRPSVTRQKSDSTAYVTASAISWVGGRVDVEQILLRGMPKAERNKAEIRFNCICDRICNKLGGWKGGCGTDIITRERI